MLFTYIRSLIYKLDIINIIFSFLIQLPNILSTYYIIEVMLFTKGPICPDFIHYWDNTSFQYMELVSFKSR